MRFLKPLLTALLAVFAIIGGLFVSLIVAITTAMFLLARHAFGSKMTAAAGAPRPRRPRTPPADAIDVVATEVPGESPRIGTHP